MLHGVWPGRKRSLLDCSVLCTCLGWLFRVLYKHQPLNQRRAEDHRWVCRDHCSVCCACTFPNQVTLFPFLASVTLWDRKQKPSGWVLEINYLDVSPGPVSFRKGTSVFIYLTSVVCSWVRHCVKGSRDSLVRKIESRRLEYIMCKQNFYGTLCLNGRRSWHITCGFCEVHTTLVSTVPDSQPLLTYCWLFTYDTCVANIAPGLQVSLSISSRRNRLKLPLCVSPSF